MSSWQVGCPDCGQEVDRVDKEYARHYVDGILCNMSRRRIAAEGETRDGV